jgi:hypothetical protein
MEKQRCSVLKIGFLLSHLGEAELSNLFVRQANEFLLNNNDTDLIAFLTNRVNPKTHPSFGTMNINEAFDYDGCVIATNLYDAFKLVNFPGPKYRYFYLWDLNWCGFGFEELSELFNNPKLKIIARNPEHKDIIETCWNRKVHHVIPNCDVSTFVEMVRKDETK